MHSHIHTFTHIYTYMHSYTHIHINSHIHTHVIHSHMTHSCDTHTLMHTYTFITNTLAFIHTHTFSHDLHAQAWVPAPEVQISLVLNGLCCYLTTSSAAVSAPQLVSSLPLSISLGPATLYCMYFCVTKSALMI